MQLLKQYDVAIVGGGLAGLSCAIQLLRLGHSVILFEKEKYPFHKVCGEYISMESWNFLVQLGLPLQEMHLPILNTLFLTAPNGKSFSTQLPLGGFGLSRYLLDDSLAGIAKSAGVHVMEETKVNDINFNEIFEINFASRLTEQKAVSAKVCCGAFGKRSNLDVKWERAFINTQDKRLQNYVGIKYHIHADWKENIIGLHNFKNGYCGISKIEAEMYCLCYMTKSENLKTCNNNIEQLEKEVLWENPHLKEIFFKSEKLPQFPVTISQINFNKKSQIENHVLMLGDAGGMITPLCGNGMSIALHTSKIAAQLIHIFLQGSLLRSQMETAYQQQWKYNFEQRLKTGRTLQRFFGSIRLSNSFVGLFNTFPLLAGPVVKMTHGKSF